MTFKQEDYQSALRSMGRANDVMQAAITMPHSTKEELDCKLSAVKDAYYIMLLQQSKFKLWSAKYGIQLELYYNMLE